jgi:DNA-binding NtrC family response regulator
MSRILILEPEADRRAKLSAWLEADGHSVVRASSAGELVEVSASRAGLTAVVACAALADDALGAAAGAPVLIYAPAPAVAEAVRLMRAGADDYLAIPQDAAELRDALSNTLARRTPSGEAFAVNGTSQAMRTLADSVAKVAPTESTVLVSGETGTGKELVARALHAGSKRRLAPLIAINCATIPGALIEAEIFGRESEGVRQRGLLEAAEGGTLFLDEIGELPLAVQGRLLTVLQDHSANIRLIAATQRDLESLIENGQFRQDLYYRLNVVSLRIPPLRERGEDIITLARNILGKTAARLGKPEPELSEEACEVMVRYRWPGNVRELENALERAVILGSGEAISSELLAISADEPSRKETRAQAPDQTMEDYFVSFVTAHQDQLTETELAERLGISRKSLWERRQRLNIPRKKTRKRGPRRDVR